MSTKLPVRGGTAALVCALLLFLVPFAAQALGLGKLRVNSRISEPLDLLIELRSAGPDDLKSLTVGLASRQDFSRIGLPYPEQGRLLRFTVEGSRGIRVTTEQPINAAYLHFLVAASWSGGKVIREYTALLDPPLYTRRNPAPKALPVVAAPSRRPPEPERGTYRVKGGDNLSAIVNRLGLARSVSSYQAMMALYDANPKAFAGNVNLLKRGATLRIPTEAEMRRLDRKTARREFGDHQRRFREERAASAKPPPAAKPVQAEKHEPKAIASVTSPEEPVSGGAGSQSAPLPADDAGKPRETAEAEAATGAPPPAGDRLRIAQIQAGPDEMDTGEPAADALPPSAEVAALRARLNELDESLLASRLENEELRKTIKGIEQQLARLTQLLTVENRTLALARQAPVGKEGEPAEPLPGKTETGRSGVESMTGKTATAEKITAGPGGVAGTVVDEKAEATSGDGKTAGREGSGGSPKKWWLGAKGAGEEAPAGISAGESQSGEAPASEMEAAQMAARTEKTEASTEKERGEAPPGAAVTSVAPETGMATKSEASRPKGVEPAIPVPSQSVSADREEEVPGTGAETVPRSVADRGIVETLEEIPQLAAGAFGELPDTTKRLVAGGGVLLLGLGALGLVRRRRRHRAAAGPPAAAVPPARPGGIVLNLDEEEPEEAAPAELPAEVTPAVDPLAEADAYIAYDRDDQAIQVLREAWREAPREEVGEKLLELYHKHGDRRAFTNLAEELYLRIGREAPAWAGIAKMGRTLNPEHPLFAVGSARREEAAAPTQEASAPPVIELDEIGFGDAGPLQPEEEAPRRERSGSSPLALEEEIVVPAGEEGKDAKEAAADQAVGESGPPEAAGGAGRGRDDEPETALNLARAYFELGEKEIARGFIDEVLRDGSVEQRREASALVEKFG